jgi:hypothetical protein
MTDWSPVEAIAMERRHILEGEKRIARQVIITAELTRRSGCDDLVREANDLLRLLREIVELSRVRLRYLEESFGEAPTSN